MALFGGLFKSVRPEQKAVSSPFAASISQSVASLLGMAGSNRKYLLEYRNWVYACVQARSEDVGNINIKVLKNGEEVESGELIDLLYKVNPYMTKKELFSGTQAFLDLEGNAFWFLARDGQGQGKVREIYLLRPDRVRVVQSKENPLEVSGYVYVQKDGQKVPFDKNQVLHFKNFNPNAEHPFPHRGMGVVEAAIWSIDTDNETRQWNYSFFKNSARPSGIIEKDTAIDEDEFKRVKAQIEQAYQGSQNAHKTMFLTDGMKWKDVGVTQRDMDFVEQRRFGRDEILAMFRVPKSVIGIVEDVNRANAEASDYVFASRTVKPLMENIISYLNEFLVPEFGDNLELSYEDPVPEARDIIVNEYVQGVDKWLTRNEIRKREGLPPIDNGDVLYGALGNVPVGTVIEEQKATPKPETKEPGTTYVITEDVDPVKKTVRDFIAKLPKKEEVPTERKVSEEQKKAYVSMWKSLFDVNEKPLKKDMSEYFDAQETEVLKNLRSELKAVDDFLFDEEEAIEAGISLITPHIRKFIKESGGQAADLVGAGSAFDMDNPEVIKFIKERSKYFAKTITTTTREALVDTLKEGVENGEDLPALAERVSRVYGVAKDSRSVMIARTEVAASANFGAQEAYKQAGVTKHEWIVVNPQDDDCLLNNGEVEKIGESFPSGDSQPPVHPNCECTTVPVF